MQLGLDDRRVTKRGQQRFAFMTRTKLLDLFEAQRSHWLDSESGRTAVAEMHHAVVENGAREAAKVLLDDGGWRIALQALGMGAELPIHDHPGTRGMLLVHEGALRVRHFDVIEHRPGARTAMLVIRGERVLHSGGWDWIGKQRNNLHSLYSKAHITLVFSIRQSVVSPETPRSSYAFIFEPVAGDGNGVAVVKRLKLAAFGE